VSVTVGTLCTPVIFFTEQLAFQSELDFFGLRRGWLFSNLLGAAYLQMYWLMTSVGELSRCEHYGRIISLSRPRPEGRKRRRNRRFCDDACPKLTIEVRKKPGCLEAAGPRCTNYYTNGTPIQPRTSHEHARATTSKFSGGLA
jgi:hypothetical protein